MPLQCLGNWWGDEIEGLGPQIMLVKIKGHGRDLKLQYMTLGTSPSLYKHSTEIIFLGIFRGPHIDFEALTLFE